MSLDYPQEPAYPISDWSQSFIGRCHTCGMETSIVNNTCCDCDTEKSFKEWRRYARQLESILDLRIPADLDAVRPYLICMRDEDNTLKAVRLAAKYGGDPEDIPEYLRDQTDSTHVTTEQFAEIIWRAFRRAALKH